MAITRKPFAVMAAAAIAVSLAGCGGGEGSGGGSKEAAKPGGTLHYLTGPRLVEHWDPQRMYIGRDLSNANRLFYRGLTTFPVTDDPKEGTTPVADRVFFVGVEGGFSFSGIGGFTIRFAVSELGPLGVFLSASLPTGILIYPPAGLTINDFSAGVEFFKTRFREHIMRSARSMTMRSRLDAREVMLARAMWIEVVRSMNRFRAMAGLAPVPEQDPAVVLTAEGVEGAAARASSVDGPLPPAQP